MKVSEVLGRAHDHIQNVGWTQGGDGIDREGRTCAVQAIFQVQSRNCIPVAAYKTLLQVLGLPVTYYHADLPRMEAVFSWNDSPSQTKENVLHTLELAKLHAEEIEKQETLTEEMAKALVQR
jgi:hypothetical protein